MALLPELVKIVPYDPVWPELFACEQSSLQQIFAGSHALIEHVGSTAVLGLGAKPIIDMMVGVDALEHVTVRLAALDKLGYEYVPAFEVYEPDRRFLRKPKTGARQFHLHCVRKDSPFFADHILFRDCLRTMPELAASYLQLKQSLASRMANDRHGYTEGKTDFINQALARVRQEKLVSESGSDPRSRV